MRAVIRGCFVKEPWCIVAETGPSNHGASASLNAPPVRLASSTIPSLMIEKLVIYLYDHIYGCLDPRAYTYERLRGPYSYDYTSPISILRSAWKIDSEINVGIETRRKGGIF
jgi:hypothetical protein